MNYISKVAEMLGVEIDEELLIYEKESNKKIGRTFRFTENGLELYDGNYDGYDVWKETTHPTFMYLITGRYEAVRRSTLTNEEFRRRFLEWERYYEKYGYKTHKLEGNNHLAEVLNLIGLKAGEIFLLCDVETGNKMNTIHRFTGNSIEFCGSDGKWKEYSYLYGYDILKKLVTGEAIALYGNEIAEEEIVKKYNKQRKYAIIKEIG